MATKSKATAAIAAGVLSAALLLGGTLAWYSEEQSAENRAIVDINPGGRLHDDFDGSNKDVYVENFGDKDTGVPIYARIRLDEYMEYGQDAGTNLDGANRKVKVLDQNPNDDNTPNIKDESTWETYIPGEVSVEHDYKNNPTVYSEYWGWDLGQSDENKLPYYLPTFNKNKDSKAADINGTYAGENGIPYGDYKIYTSGMPDVTDTAVYDWDTDTKEEFPDKAPGYDNGGETQDEATPIDSADVLLKEEPHPIQRISSTSEVILMSDYLKLSAEDRKELKAWVYDADGWAYWSQAIQPGETTGLLLDGIEMDKVPDDNWYYGINVVGQFATMGDLSAFENEGDDFSPEAREMMSFVAGQEDKVSISGKDTIKPGTSNEYSATVTRLEMPLEGATLTWSIGSVEVDGAALGEIPADYSIDASSGTLTVSEAAEVGAVITVVAKTGEGVEAKMKVFVMDGVADATTENALTPLAAGKTASYKIIFPENDLESEEYTAPSEWQIDEIFPLSGEDIEIEYQYDPETQVLTFTQVEGGLEVWFTTPNDSNTYVKFVDPQELVATLDAESGRFLGSLESVAELDSQEAEYFYLSFEDGAGEAVELTDLKLDGEYGVGYWVGDVEYHVDTELLVVPGGTPIITFSAKRDGTPVVVELSHEKQEWTASFDDLTKEEDESYSGYICDGAMYVFTNAEGQKLSMRFSQDEDYLPDSGVHIANYTAEGFSLLSVPEDYYGDDTTIELVLIDGENEYEVTLSLKELPIIEGSVKVQGNDFFDQRSMAQYTCEYTTTLGAPEPVVTWKFLEDDIWEGC